MIESLRFGSFDGTELAYDVAGDGPTVLLLHGFAADTAANWQAPGVFDALVDAGHRVVGYDARGHGRSDKPHDPAAYADGAMVRDARAMLDHLAIDACDVVGYSMGAIVSSRVAPGEARCRRLVLGGVGGGIVAGRPPKGAEAIADALEADDPDTIADPVARAFRRFAERTGADRLALAAIQRANAFAAPARLDEITAPTLVICGDDDRLVGPPQALAAAIEGATATTVTGDHLTAVADPRFAGAIVDFLAAD